MEPKFNKITDQEILDKVSRFPTEPVIKESGECFIVQSVKVYIEDGGPAEVWGVTDIAVFAEEDDAYAFAARRTAQADDSCYTVRHMYTVHHRWVEVD